MHPTCCNKQLLLYNANYNYYFWFKFLPPPPVPLTPVPADIVLSGAGEAFTTAATEVVLLA